MLQISWTPFEIVIVSLIFVILILLVYFLLVLKKEKAKGQQDLLFALNQQLNDHKDHSSSRMSVLKDSLSKSLISIYRNQQSSQMQLQNLLTTQAGDQRKEQSENYRELKSEMSGQLKEIRSVVDEKLQKTLDHRLGQSSEMISQRLETMYKGLGKLQSLAGGVDDLKRVLSNVKTRGILGEVMLRNLLSDMFDNSQYATNVATKKGSQAHVEFAIRMPSSSESELWLPIDSKFPLESAQRLMEARENTDPQAVTENRRLFSRAIDSFAKDISTKYIDPPHTTPFALMFLPSEGLFQEVLACDELFQTIQQKYNITITGPTTLSAFLSSLQMGFHTLSIQKRSNEIMNQFLDLKKEFGNYSALLSKAHKQVGSAYNSLSELEGVRLRAMIRKFDQLEKGQ